LAGHPKIKKRAELATMLKLDESTIYRWLRADKQGGINELLSLKKAPGKTPHIPPSVTEKLIKKLQHRGRQVMANYSYG
jgi:transposase